MRARPASPPGALARSLTPERPAGSRAGGILQVSLACVVWGSVGLLVRQLRLPAVSIAGLRLGFAALGVLALGLARPGTLQLRPGDQWPRLLLLGALMALNWSTFILAFQLTGVGVAVVLSFTWPIWTSLFARKLGVQPPDRATLIALTVSLAGVVLLALRTGGAPSSRDLAGMGVALLTSLTFAVMVLVSRSTDAAMPSATLNFWQSLIGALLLAPLALLGLRGGTLDARALGILVLLGAVMTGVGGTLFVAGMRILSTPEVGVISYLEPVSATVLAALFLGEHPGWRGVVGIVAVLAAGLWVLLRGASADHERGSGGAHASASQPPSTGR